MSVTVSPEEHLALPGGPAPGSETGSRWRALRHLRFVVSVPLHVVALPVQLVSGVQGALRDLGSIAVGMQSLHGELVAMRSDIGSLDHHIQGLRGDVTGLGPDLAGIHGDTSSMDRRLVELTARLEAVDALASRLGRFGARRSAARPVADGMPLP